MEKTLKPNNDKEYMRMAMLKHEETFREQVNELHRLYRIQKMLMENVQQQQHHHQHRNQKQKLEQTNNLGLESSKRPFTIDHYQQQLLLQQAQRDHNNINNIKSKITNNIIMGLDLIRPDNNQALPSGAPRLSSNGQEHIGESNGNGKMMTLDESEIELTLSLGPSTLNPRRKKSNKSNESGQSLSSSSTGSSQTKKRSPKNSDSTTTWASFSHQSGPGLETGFSNGQQNSNNPPWLYQALSLKLT